MFSVVVRDSLAYFTRIMGQGIEAGVEIYLVPGQDRNVGTNGTSSPVMQRLVGRRLSTITVSIEAAGKAYWPAPD